MARVPAKIVPLSPRLIMRAPGMPLAHSSTLKPFGTFSLSSGIFSGAVTVSGVACGLRFRLCLVFAISACDWSSGLASGPLVGRAGCWAFTHAVGVAVARAARATAATSLFAKSPLLRMKRLPCLFCWLPQGAHGCAPVERLRDAESRRQGPLPVFALAGLTATLGMADGAIVRSQTRHLLQQY